MYNNGNSSKNVTGASVVDGTMESADFADNGLSGDKIDGGIISNFQSTGIDDRLPTSKVLTLSTTGIDVTGAVTADGLDISKGANLNLGVAQLALDNFSNEGVGMTFTRTISDSDLMALGVIDTSNFGLFSRDGIVFATGGGATYSATLEAMRIDSSGNVLVGAISPPGTSTTGFGVVDAGGSGLKTIFSSSSTTNAVSMARWYNPNGNVGSIQASGSATSYNTSSDYRLKENVVPMTGSIDRLKALKPSKFNFIADADTTVDGFLAHEAGNVVPECATGTKDAMTVEVLYTADDELPEGKNIGDVKEASVPDYQGIDQSKLVPLLVSALQEAIARIETLENV
jgi:hypothetical protein